MLRWRLRAPRVGIVTRVPQRGHGLVLLALGSLQGVTAPGFLPQHIAGKRGGGCGGHRREQARVARRLGRVTGWGGVRRRLLFRPWRSGAMAALAACRAGGLALGGVHRDRRRRVVAIWALGTGRGSTAWLRRSGSPARPARPFGIKIEGLGGRREPAPPALASAIGGGGVHPRNQPGDGHRPGRRRGWWGRRLVRGWAFYGLLDQRGFLS